MIIKFQGEHKSLKTFESEYLEDFSVITGKNGCGKSQLVELINLTRNNQKTPLLNFDFEPKISKIQIEGIENDNLNALNNSKWRDKIEIYISRFNDLGKNTKLLAETFINNNVWPKASDNEHFFKSITTITAIEIEELAIKSLMEILMEIRDNREQKPTLTDVASGLFNKDLFNNYTKKTIQVAIFTAEYRNKQMINLVEADFYLTPIPDYLLDELELFNSELEFVFYNYAKRRDQNQRLFFEKSTYHEKNNSIPDNEFINEFIPPWTSINEILKQHRLEFQFKGIERKDFSSDVYISFPLIKTSVGKNIEFKYLSTGEKVIIGLIIKLFTSDYYKEKLELPELIILDEPDAYLHPEMSKLLIDVLHGTFVKKLGIKVIMITHSPSTVALCPDNSIYELKNEPVTTLNKIEKNDALKLLTNFIPTLSIDYKNHKQVFVESPTDRKYYQTIFNKLNQERNYPFKLYFISNTYGKGNCEQVKKIVNDLRESGNTSSFGIIDWDTKNHSTNYIKVHGQNKRYSVENYLYDPIYLSILFMNLKAHNVYKELDLEETINQYSIGNESDDFLQKISNWFFEKYYEVHKMNNEVISKYTEVEYLNGKKIKMPTWFLEFKGHDYEIRLKKVFKALEKFTGEGDLQNEITLILGKCYPFIPKDSEQLIEEIINCS